jgi:molecular chaperone HscB
VPAPTAEYYSLFGLEPRFAIDPERLKRAYDDVLALVHPDRHVRAGAGERRAALQLASTANEAYETLRRDTARAAYLCGLRGAVVEGEGAAPMEAGFLEQQMSWREAIDEAREGGAAAAQRVADVLRQAGERRQLAVQRLRELLDEKNDARAAAVEVRALMFLDKLLAEVARLNRPAQAGVS